MNRRNVVTIVTTVALVGVAIITTRPLPLGEAYAFVLAAACIGVFAGAFIGTVIIEVWPARRPWWRPEKTVAPRQHQEYPQRP